MGMRVEIKVLLLTSLLPPFVWATKILDLSLDVDHAPDSNGSYTHAALVKEDLPPSLTICSAYMVEAWTTAYSAARMWMLRDDDWQPADDWLGSFLRQFQKVRRSS